ncbi:MAG: hypothetical protein OIF55_19585 [Amphritea sp.]|nr:hypothetical protein [Amphritea sp.]
MQVISGESVLIREVRFSGAVELLSEPGIKDEIEKFITQSVGKQYDFNGLRLLADQITLLLKKEGWILARAYLPQQDISNGILTIAVIRGQLDSKGPGIIIEPAGEYPLRINTTVLEGISSEYLTVGNAINERELERALLLINDLPGITARARLETGEEPESTRIHILAEEGRLFTGQLQSNNFGNRFTGRSQLQAELTLNDPSGHGDQLNTSLTASEGIRLGRINYGLPLGYRGWHANLAYTFLDYEVIEGQASEQADYTGEAETVEAALRYPIVRSNTQNIWLGLGYRSDRFEDRFNDTRIGDKQIHSGRVNLYGDNTDQWQGGGRSDWSLEWKHGNLDLSGLAQQQQNDRSAFNTAGEFNKLEYTLSRHQYLASDLSLFIGLNGQFASKNLDSSQKFFPGGPNGVRAYPGGEAPADEGQLLRAELRYNVKKIPQRLGRLQLQFFYDQAWIKQSNSPPANVPITNAENANRYRLAGTGVGLHLAKDKEYGVSFNWARKLGHNPGRDAATGFDSDEQSNSYRIWLQGVVWF